MGRGGEKEVHGTFRNLRTRSKKVFDINYRGLGRGQNGNLTVLRIVLTWLCCSSYKQMDRRIVGHQRLIQSNQLVPSDSGSSWTTFSFSEATTLTNRHDDTPT